MSFRGNHSAFPGEHNQGGMTLREYAAIQIMSGLVANSGYDPIGARESGHSKAVAVAAECADALLDELEVTR